MKESENEVVRWSMLEENEGTFRSWGRTIGRCCPYGVDGRDPLGIPDEGNPAKGPTSRFP